MASTTLSSKLPEEKVFVDLDFTNLFDTGVSITSVQYTATRYAGTADANPSAILNSSGSHVGMIASVLVEDGVAGCTYLIACAANGDDGSTNVIEVLLPVVDVRLG